THVRCTTVARDCSNAPARLPASGLPPAQAGSRPNHWRRRRPAGVMDKMRKIPIRPAPAADAARLLRLLGGGLLALGAEFPALLALKPLGVGFLRTFERGGGARFLGLLFRRRIRFGLGRLCLGRRG